MANEEKTNDSFSYSRVRVILILLPCVAILVFAVFRYLDFHSGPSTRSPAARAQAELRTMATGIETYMIDQGVYPSEAWQVTTPVAYLSTLPRDNFAESKTQFMKYYTDGEGYILVSRGPDRIPQILPKRDFHFAENRDGIAPALIDKCYDPSNGSKSAGDLIRIGPTTTSMKARDTLEKKNPPNEK